MKYYYYFENDQQFGPFTYEELKNNRIKKHTMVWFEGISEWAPAETFDELKDILISTPPPFVKQNIKLVQHPNIDPIPSTPVNSDGYDTFYKKETGATVVGVLIIFAYLIWFIIKLKIIEDSTKIDSAYIFDPAMARGIEMMLTSILRIAVTIWVVKIADRQNRDQTSWGILAFIFPSITLIIIGFQNKLKLKVRTNSNIPIPENLQILKEKIRKYYSEYRYSDVIAITNKMIELAGNKSDYLNFRQFATLSRGISYYKTNDFEKSKSDLLNICTIDNLSSMANYYLGNIELMFFNYDEAVIYWQKSFNSGYDEAKQKLNLYYNFKGVYILNKNDLHKKLNTLDDLNDNIDQKHYSLKYKSGIQQLNSLDINLHKQTCVVNKYGLTFLLKRPKEETIYIGISYYEITEFEYIIKSNEFKLLLIDNTTISLEYDFDFNNGHVFRLIGRLYNNSTNRNIKNDLFIQQSN